jgi:hypothetical protein
VLEQVRQDEIEIRILADLTHAFQGP